MKATAIAPSNIAFSKYWGQADPQLILPLNDSISMSLDGVETTTSVEFSQEHEVDQVFIGDTQHAIVKVAGDKHQKVVAQLNRLRAMAEVQLPAKVVSQNSFPTGVGIASSASAFSALTLATVSALGIDISTKELSILTRLAGSGSATRSVYGGFVKWKKGNTSETSFAAQIADEHHWDLVDIIAITSTEEKKFSSLEGHTAAKQSPYLKARLSEMSERNRLIESAILTKDFSQLGEEIEKDMFSLHCMAMTSSPSILYWNGTSVEIIHAVKKLRDQGIEAYATLDAGANVHIIARNEDGKKIATTFSQFAGVQSVIVAPIGKGARLSTHHIF